MAGQKAIRAAIRKETGGTRLSTSSAQAVRIAWEEPMTSAITPIAETR